MNDENNINEKNDEYATMMKNDDLYSVTLQPRNVDDRCQSHLHSDLETLADNCCGSEVIILNSGLDLKGGICAGDIDPKNPKDDRVVPIIVPIISQNPRVPNPPSQPTGCFLMGAGGGWKPT